MGKVAAISQGAKSNRDTPNIVLSRNFGDKAKVMTLHVHPKAIAQFDGANFRAKLGEYAGLVHGNVPHGTSGLLGTVALFKGVKRPCLETNFDAEVYAFISRPDYTYTYADIRKFSGLPPEKKQKPLKSVFATYVKPYRDMAAAVRESELPESYGIEGVILDWEWVLADEDGLPDDHGNRYDEAIW